jgi:RES domain
MRLKLSPEGLRELSDIPVAFVDGPLYRVHLASRDVQHFSTRSLYRFDPPECRQTDFGTCYLATSREGAFLDALGGFRPLPEHLVNQRVITEVIDFPGCIADLRFGYPSDQFGERKLYGGLPGQGHYAVSQEWAAAFWDAGFDGIQYYARYAGLTEVAIALWHVPVDGREPSAFKCGDPEPIDDALRARVESLFEVEIYPDLPLLDGDTHSSWLR